MAGRGISVLQLYHAWINSILQEDDQHIENLSELKDGAVLYHLMEILWPKVKEDKKFQISKDKVPIQRIQAVLDLLHRNSVKVSVGSHEIFQGDTKALLDILWGIILNFFIHTPESPVTQRTVRVGKRHLLDWCRQQQPGLNFNNNTSLGKNFGKSNVLAKVIGTNCEIEESEDTVEYLSNAIAALDEKLGISSIIISPVDIAEGTIDEHALLIYLALFRRKSKKLIQENNNNSQPSVNGHSEESRPLGNTPSGSLVNDTSSGRVSPSPRNRSPCHGVQASPNNSSAQANIISNEVNHIELTEDLNEKTFNLHQSPRPSPRQSSCSPNRSLTSSPSQLNINDFDIEIDLTDSGKASEVETLLAASSSGPANSLQVPSSGKFPGSPKRSLESSPRVSPATSPRRSPAISPQRSPTISPRRSPTISPHRSPTASPHRSPTISPWGSPAVSPQRTPAISPQRSPAISPSNSPVVSPEKSPVTTPRRSPAVTPRRSPAGTPQRSPLLSPRSSPVISPQRSPAVSPPSSPAVSPPKSPAVSPERSPVVSPRRSLAVSPRRSPAVSPQRSPVISPNRSPAVSPQRSPAISPPKSATVSPERSPVESPRRSPAVSPQRSPAVTPQRSPATSPSRSPISSPYRSPAVTPQGSPIISPKISPAVSPQRSPVHTPPGSPRSSPVSFPRQSLSTPVQGYHTVSPQNSIKSSTHISPQVSPQASQKVLTPRDSASNFESTSRGLPPSTRLSPSSSPIGSPATARRPLVTSPLGSPTSVRKSPIRSVSPNSSNDISPIQSPRLQRNRHQGSASQFSPRLNGPRSPRNLSPHRAYIGFQMDGADQLDLNGLDEKESFENQIPDGDGPESARSNVSSDWLSSSSGSQLAYNTTKRANDVCDGIVDGELAEAIKNKVSEHFEYDSQASYPPSGPNTPRAAEDTLTGAENTSTELPSGMSRSLSTDDLMTMLEAIGNQGKTLQEKLKNQEEEILLMHEQGIKDELARHYMYDVDHTEEPTRDYSDVKTGILPENEIVNKLLEEISEMKRQMEAMEKKNHIPVESPKLNLDGEFKDNVHRLSHSMEHLGQRLGDLNHETTYGSMDTRQMQPALHRDVSEYKPPSGAFKQAELRWHETEKALKEQVSFQKGQISELEANLDVAHNENQELQAKLEKASTSIRSRVDEMGAMIDQTRKEAKALKSENTELSLGRERDKQVILKLEDRLEMLEKSLSSLQKENANLTEKLEAAMKSEAENAGKVMSSTNRLEALVKENNFLKEKLDETETEKKKLQQDVIRYIKRCREAEGKRADTGMERPSYSSGGAGKEPTSSQQPPIPQKGSQPSPKPSLGNTANPPKTDSVKPGLPAGAHSKDVEQKRGSYQREERRTLSLPEKSRAAKSPVVVNQPEGKVVHAEVAPASTRQADSSPTRPPRTATTPTPSPSMTNGAVDKTPPVATMETPNQNRQERKAIRPNDSFHHHEKIMLKAKKALQEAENASKEKTINLAELSRKYPDLDRYSHRQWNETENKFEDVVEKVTVVSKALDSEIEKSRNLYRKMQSSKVMPLFRSRLSSDESKNISGNDSDRNVSHDSDKATSERTSWADRVNTPEVGHRRVYSSPDKKVGDQEKKTDMSRKYRTREYGSTQNISTSTQTNDIPADHTNRYGDEKPSTPPTNTAYRSSSADRLGSRHSSAPSDRMASAGEVRPQTSPVADQESSQTPLPRTDIRDILAKRFGSAPLPSRMGTVLRGRKTEEFLQTPPSTQQRHLSSMRGSVPVRGIHRLEDKPQLRDEVEQTHLVPRTLRTDRNTTDDHRHQETLPHRRLYENEEQRNQNDYDPYSRKNMDRTPSLKSYVPRARQPSDSYSGGDMYDDITKHTPDSKPPIITVTPPDDSSNRQAPHGAPRQYSKFSGSAGDYRDSRGTYQKERRTPSNLRERHPSSPPRLNEGRREDDETSKSDGSSSALVNWRKVAQDHGADVDVGDDYPYFGISRSGSQDLVEPKHQPKAVYVDHSQPGEEPVVTSCESDQLLTSDRLFQDDDYRKPVVTKPAYGYHRRAQSVDNKDPWLNQVKAGSGEKPSSTGGDNLRRQPSWSHQDLRTLEPTQRSPAGGQQYTSKPNWSDPDPSLIVFDSSTVPKLSPAQIAYADSLIEKYTRT